MLSQKAALRRELRKARREQAPEDLQRDSQAIREKLLSLPELRQAKRVFCYLSCGGEVETHTLVQELLQEGKTVLVPRCREQRQMDCVAIGSLSELHPGKYGILEPPAHRAASQTCSIDFAIVPAVACGRDGTRLGQGGGYYDRFLEQFTGCFAALCQERFLLQSVPCEAHDKAMKIIVTPQRVLRFEDV